MYFTFRLPSLKWLRIGLLVAVFGVIHLRSVAQREIYSKAKISLSADKTLTKLGLLGIECDHGEHKPGTWFISAFSQAEIQRIKNAGYLVDILIEDVAKDFRERNARAREKSVTQDNYPNFCNKSKNRKVPVNWKLGSMGGHLRYEEMLAQLDSMRKKYPTLVTARADVDTTRTWGGRRLQFVKISDNPSTNEPSEPQVLYTAVHHAREPVGMHQLLLYMWYLLENYAGDPEVKALVNNTEIYFVPCINPDGYIFNQTTDPAGGGMWRKNRRSNGDGTFGVDLNRNYGYNWGYDDFGSSPETSFETYRGPSGFSEPETRAIKRFTETHLFKAALNYHTYANLVIHPWGYESIQTEDSVLYRTLTREMVRENNYRVGTAMEVLNYNSNGSSDDFMYSAQPGKPKIYAMTPEIGDWFWPLTDEILPLCMENLHQNLTVLRSVHPMLSFRDSTGVFLRPGLSPQSSGEARLLYHLRKNLVNTTTTNFTLSLKPLPPYPPQIQTVTRQYPSGQIAVSRIDSVVFANLPDQPFGTNISWEVVVDNGLFQVRDTIIHSADYPSCDAVMDRVDCDVLTNWEGDFVVANTGQQQGAGCITDSDGDYLSDDEKYIRRVKPFDLRGTGSDASRYEMSFWTKFAIEKNYDYSELQISTDSVNFESVCTDFTVFSSPFSQQAGFDNVIPIWDGFVSKWRKEMLDLTPYRGNKVWIRFHFKADAGTEYDGFYFDNIIVRKSSLITSVADRVEENPHSFQVYPNPASGLIYFTADDVKTDSRVSIYNSLGKLIDSFSFKGQREWHAIMPAGTYQAVFTDASGNVSTQRFVLK